VSRAGRLDRICFASLAVLLAWGVARCFALIWICDDAFVSLRYAENLLLGRGLVYNAGEYVEGYTNLLWTLLLAGLMKLGVPDLLAAELPGIAALAALAAGLVHAGWRRARDHALPFLPLAAGLVLVSNDFHVWATGGLETMLFALLATEPLLLLRMRPASSRTAVGAGVLLALLLLTRPDGLLFVAAGVLSPWIPWGARERTACLRLSFLIGAPVALVLAVLVPWKLSYYGELLPTAFYAKSATRPFVSQGLMYVGLYLVKNWFLVAAALLAVAAFAVRRPLLGSATRADDAFLLASAGLFTAYIVHVGGDFMFARRILPVAPLVFFVIESRIVQIAAPRARLAAAAAALLAAALPVPVYARHQVINDIADEPSFYPPGVIEARRRQGEGIARALEGTPARVAIEGGLLSLAYFGRLPYVAETNGLTQYSLAKLPLEHRGAIGHEKKATVGWFHENRIHFLVRYEKPPVRRPAGPPRMDEIYFGDLAMANVLLYDDAVMEPLRRQPEIHFVPIERVFAQTKSSMQAAPLARAEELYGILRDFYLDDAGERGAEWDQELREILAEKRRQALLPREDSGPSPAASRAAASTEAAIARARAAPLRSTSSTSSGRLANASRFSRIGSKWASTRASRSFFTSP
jgi:hypothetical protein